MFPREHGAWGMLITTFIIGALCASTFSPAVLLFGGASLSYFLLRVPLLALKDARWQKSYKADTRRAFLWLITYAAMMAVFGIPLFLIYKKWLLLIFFALSLPMLFIHIIYSSEDFRSIKNELLSFSALCMTAPLAYYVATDELTARTFSLWILCYLYYSGSVFYVKMNVAARVRKNEVATLKGKFSVARDALLYHTALPLTVFLFSHAFRLSPNAYFAFFPSLWKVFARTLNLNEPVPIKKLGWMEVAYASLFAALVIISYRIA